MAIGRAVLITSAVAVASLGLLWGAAAIWFDGPESPVAAGALAASVAIAGIAALVALRPWSVALCTAALLVGGIGLWWARVPARNDRDWLPDVARLPIATVDGDRLTITNVRNFDYRSETDFSEHWETRTYDLAALRGSDLFFSFWGPTLIAHTIASWEFADGQHLAISIETRKERGESYSAVRGFFHQYELYYVVADERDVIGVRTNHRGERVYLYRVQMPPDRARALLLDYVRAMNDLAAHPRWYNALTSNCTTTIREHARQIGPVRPWTWQILANGYLDRLLYDRGVLDTSRPFEQLRAASDITERAKEAGNAADFSARIRRPVE
jgi:hypothetical protein